MLIWIVALVLAVLYLRFSKANFQNLGQNIDLIVELILHIAEE